MDAFKKHTGIVVVIDRANIDTDAIIPKQFLKKIERTGFGKHLFHDWRYLDDAETKPNPDFALNKPQCTGATVLLARDNFGCGSSREHAPWALADYGFKVIIAPSFADIFYSNGLKNGILLVRLSPEEINQLFRYAVKKNGATITIDLPSQTVSDGAGVEYHFDIDAFSKECLLNGLDSIGWTDSKSNAIREYEEARKKGFPWIFAGI